MPPLTVSQLLHFNEGPKSFFHSFFRHSLIWLNFSNYPVPSSEAGADSSSIVDVWRFPASAFVYREQSPSLADRNVLSDDQVWLHDNDFLFRYFPHYSGYRGHTSKVGIFVWTIRRGFRTKSPKSGMRIAEGCMMATESCRLKNCGLPLLSSLVSVWRPSISV